MLSSLFRLASISRFLTRSADIRFPDLVRTYAYPPTEVFEGVEVDVAIVLEVAVDVLELDGTGLITD